MREEHEFRLEGGSELTTLGSNMVCFLVLQKNGLFKSYELE